MAPMCTYFAVFLILTVTVVKSEDDQTEFFSPRPVRDRFRYFLSNVNEEKTQDEISDFVHYKCEKMVVIRNKAEADFLLTCKSPHDAPKTVNISPGNSFIFSFRPQKQGGTRFWCTVEYQQYVSRFDVYNEDQSYMCPREMDEVYQYTVTHDGIYADGKKGSEGQKIRALFKGHNNYILWEEYENNETDGYLTGALVDGGMCNDVPEQFNDKTAAVTVCDNHCVILYEHIRCVGKTQVIQAHEECIDTPLSAELQNKLSSVKGC